MYRSILVASLVWITVLGLASASHVRDINVAHRHRIRRAPEATSAAIAMEMLPRSESRFTFFKTGLGACGKTNQPTDFIVALNSAQWDGGVHCFEWITIDIGGKTTQAQIVDECPGCPYLGLDFSSGLFDFFASEVLGVIFGSWTFDDSASTSSTLKSPSPTPTVQRLKATPASQHSPSNNISYRQSTSSIHTRATTSMFSRPTYIPGSSVSPRSTRTSESGSPHVAISSTTLVTSASTGNPEILVHLNAAAVSMGAFIAVAAQATGDIS